MTDIALVQSGSHVTLHYRVALANTDHVDVMNTFGARPATLQLGAGELAEPLESCLIGLKTGDHVTFELEPGEAFGEHNPDLVQRLSRSVLDAESSIDADYKPGDLIEFAPPDGSANGRRFSAVLRELNDEVALFDFNHPLAGQAIRFEVKIIGVL